MHTKSTASTTTQSSPKDHPGEPLNPLSASIFRLKECRTCGEERPLWQFYRYSTGTRGLRLDCLRCLSSVKKRRRPSKSAAEVSELRCRQCRTRQPLAEFEVDRRCRTGRRPKCRTCRQAPRLKRQQRREELNLPDQLLKQDLSLLERRIDLGIAIAHATCPPGHCRSLEEIAAYTGLTESGVQRIEQRALEKMRERMQRILATFELENLEDEEVES